RDDVLRADRRHARGAGRICVADTAAPRGVDPGRLRQQASAGTAGEHWSGVLAKIDPVHAVTSYTPLTSLTPPPESPASLPEIVVAPISVSTPAGSPVGVWLRRPPPWYPAEFPETTVSRSVIVPPKFHSPPAQENPAATQFAPPDAVLSRTALDT